jgi:hypothetical protein
MNDFHRAFPPIPVRDDVPAICAAIAMLGLVVGGWVLSNRLAPAETQVTANASAQTPPAP